MEKKYSSTNDGINNGVIANKINGGLHITVPEINNKLYSHLGVFVKTLSKLDMEEQLVYKENWCNKEYTIDGKIIFNNIQKYKWIIEEYSKYTVMCEEIFNVIDDNNVGSKQKILKNIHRIYLHELGALVGRESDCSKIMRLIRDGADTIFDNIKVILRKKLNSEFNNQEVYLEDLEDALEIIVCYAFMECKILEKPGGKYDSKL